MNSLFRMNPLSILAAIRLLTSPVEIFDISVDGTRTIVKRRPVERDTCLSDFVLVVCTVGRVHQRYVRRLCDALRRQRSTLQSCEFHHRKTQTICRPGFDEKRFSVDTPPLALANVLCSLTSLSNLVFCGLFFEVTNIRNIV